MHGRFSKVGLILVVAVLTVSGTSCVGQHDPTGYTESVRTHFIDGYLAGFAPKDGSKDPQALRHRAFATCLYDQMTDKKTGIKFEEFKTAQQKIRDDPTNPANTIDKLIPEFAKFQKTCNVKVNKDIAGPSPSTN